MARLGSLTHRGVRIRCLGVWDTVGNIGIPFVGGHTWTGNVAVHDTELSPQVDIGLQALAIDEPRGPFSPSLWTRHRGAALPPAQTIEQVWFAGSHANVGGGFTDCSLSDIPLVWMAERASALTGVAFDMRRLQSNAACDPLGELVDPTAEGIYRTSRMLPFLRLIHQVEAGIPPWRRRVIGTWRTNRLAAFLETVNESIHPSVLERLDRPARSRFGNTTQQVAYHPRSLVCALERRCGVT
jgi:hypothetical protein